MTNTINFEMQKNRMVYTDDHGNQLGWAEYQTDTCQFLFHARTTDGDELFDGLANCFDCITALSMEPLGTVALAIRQMADAAGY